MASTNKTTNLELNQWLPSDVPKWADHNQDNENIDAAIGNLSGLVTTDKTSLVKAINEAAQSGGGEVGPPGPANTLSIGTVQKGTVASASITGASPNQTLNLTLPQGDTGNTGAPGAAATIAVGTTVTGAPGTDASAVNEGTSSAAIFKFIIPRGADGADGADGTDGREVELQKTATHIQWRYTGGTWTNLVSLDDIKGNKGDTGEKGDDGDKGDKGDTGDTGNGIASVTLVSGNHAPGTLDKYRITFTDATTYDFDVYNGADGTGAGDMLKATYDPTNKNADAFLLSNMTGDAAHRTVTDTEKSTWNGKLGASGDGSGVTAAFTAAGTRANITTGETLATLFGKLAKWFADFGTLAWKSIIVTADITDANVTSAKLANMAAYTVKGRNAYSSGVPSDVTMLDVAEYALDAGTVATTVADAEHVPLSVSATSIKKITWANVKAALKTYFDTLYASVSSILSLGETSSTAYRGDRGKAAYDHSQITSGNPHGSAPADIGAAELDGDGKVLADQTSSAIVSISANTTLTLTHAGKLLSVSNASDRTITIPTNASVAFPVGTEIEVLRYGAGAVTISAAGGVTVRSADDKTSIDKQYTAAALKKLGTNEWLLVGGLS